MALETSVIRLAFQLILGRDPAPDRVMALQRQFDTLDGLRDLLLRSPEFEKSLEKLKAAPAVQPLSHGARPAGLNLIHLHIPKTAGTSLNGKLLAGHSNAAQVTAKDAPPEIKLRNMSPEERAQVRVIAGHCVYGIHNLLSQPSCYTCLLREPKARIYSFYGYLLSTKVHPMHNWTLENTTSFGTFLSRVHKKPNLLRELDNGQVRRISGMMSALDINHTTFQQAVSHLLADNMIFGLTEAFPAFLDSLSQKGFISNTIEPRANVSTGQRNFSSITEELSQSELDLLDEFTVWDARLYTIGQAWLGHKQG